PRCPLFPYTTLFRSYPAPRSLGHRFAGERPDDVRVALEVVESETVQLDLAHDGSGSLVGFELSRQATQQTAHTVGLLRRRWPIEDRKSTRLNSSHQI